MILTAVKRPQLGLFHVACLLMLGLALGAAAAAADDSQGWAGYRGPDIAGISAESGVFDEQGQLGLTVAWKTTIGSGYSGVAVAGGKVVTMYSEGESDVMAAFDAASGKQLWSYTVGAIYKGHDGSHDGPITTPLIAGGRVYGLGPWGEFFALDAATGEQLWKTHLAEEHEVKKPHYGFGTSPLLADGVLVIGLGGEGQAVGGFDPATGEKRWTAGDDTVAYQVPVPMSVGGRRQLVGAGMKKLFGFDAASGEMLWEHEHEGGGGRGVLSMTPVPAGEGRIFLAHQNDASKLVALAAGAEAVTYETAWEGRSIRNSYNVPVFHDGHLYAFSSRFLTCVDAATGESRWRSRQPGDGFLILVDGRLVIATKNGGVHIAEATPDGYHEIAGLPVFEDLVWSAPGFAGGSVYVRSLGEIARVDLTVATGQTRIEVASRGVSDSPFDKLLAEVDAAAADAKQAVAERFLAAQKSFPVVEGEDRVHFLYHGEATDVAVAGDLFGARQEQMMTRVPGTDLFYHSMELPPDTRANYLFIKDYEEIRDPRNPRQTSSTIVGKDMEMAFSGEELPMSWFAMPGWTPPAHLEEAPEASRGTLESHEIESAALAEQPPGRPGAPPPQTTIQLDVYLPHGYAESEARYPVVYVHGGEPARERGQLPNSLDNLIGKSVAPVIVAFVDISAQGPAYDGAFVGDVVPFVDSTYRTVAAPEGRANAGVYFSAAAAMVSTLMHPDLFGKVAVQSVLLLTQIETMIYPLLEGSGESLPALYMDWGTYDMRNPHENWDITQGNRKLAQAMAEKGVELAGGEVHDGTGWSSWRNRTDRVFEALFPMK